MKTLRFLILGLLAMTVVCSAQQITNAGWYSVSSLIRTPLPDPEDMVETESFGMLSQQNVPGSPIAEVITPDIQALAGGLQNDPVKIYNYVHDHIRHVLYFGSKKGAELTLLERSGNDFDQCALLTALLNAAGYTNTTYEFGWMMMPYDNPDGSHRDLHHWLQLSLNNTNWIATSNYFVAFAYSTRAYPDLYIAPDQNTIGFQRMWVSLTIGATNYYLDPSFKVSEPTVGTNLLSAMGFSSNSVLTAAGGTDTGNYVTNLNEASLRGTLAGYTTNLLNYFQSNCPNASVQQILNGWQIVPSTNATLSQGLLFTPTNFAGMSVLDWTYQPTNLMASLYISFVGTNHLWFMPQLLGQRISLTFDTNGLAQLWQDDILLAQNSTTGTSSRTNIGLYINHPVGYWDEGANEFVDTGDYDQITTDDYQRTNSTYAILYAFEPDWGWLQKRQNQLDNYRQQGLADTSRQVTSETLNIMGLNWMLQTEAAEQAVASQLNILPQYYNRVGRMGQEAGKGYYVDIYMQLSGASPNDGVGVVPQSEQFRHLDLAGYFSSALEHGIIEQLQNSNIVAASTVKMLQLANTNKQAVFLASSTNWTTAANVRSKLVNYSSTALSELDSFISQGYYLLLPQNGSNHVAGTGSWAGYGFAGELLGNTIQMEIDGGYHGGFSSDPNVSVPVTYVNLTGQSQPEYFASTPISTPNPPTADPLDTADGTFQIEHTDLSLGQAEPRGITLSRYYNGTRRFSNPAGMAGGWIHNYSVNANSVAAPEAGLGGTTPAQMTSMLVSSSAAVGIYNNSQPDPKNWLVTALIAKWGIDQLTKNGVSINLGKDTLQFVKQPSGSFTPPANCTMTLTQSGSTYSLQQRHGNAFNFDSLGRLNTIVDQYSNTLSLTYTNNYVKTVSDWKGRSLTFTYSGTPSRLASIADSAGRSVSYGYSTTYSAQGDLTSFTDPENNTCHYIYDTNHQVTATLNESSQLVVSNLYDVLGHVTTQYTQGDPNKMWKIFWSGWQTVEQDPAGSQQSYSYDDQSRLISVKDAFGNLTQSFYDGQNHIVTTITPLAEVTQFNFDARNNLTSQIDALGFTNQFVYDNQDNLTRSIDARGNPTTYGYNVQFSLTGQTNGAGDFVNYSFNSDGTLHTRTDAGGVTTYNTYDSYGQLTHITYPGSLGGESFVNSSVGDPTSHTDANANLTSFQYNARRQLTNSIAPTNLTAKVSFDAVGNVASTTDARGNITSNRWSATRHLLATIFPATPQGVPVITNAYDNRDWLARTVDPLQQPTLYTNDTAGRLISVTDPVQHTTTFGYDADGHKLATTNAALEVTSQTWDARGSLLRLTDGAGHFSTRAYDAAGNQIVLTNRNGKKWQFQFDGANRLTNTITPLARSTSLTFNHQGLVATAKDPASQSTSFYYDAKGRLTNRTDSVATTLYGHDANGNLTSVTENGNTNAWTYDAYNRVSSYRDVFGNLIQYRYDASGNVTNLIYPGGKNVYYAYDSLNRLTNVTDWAQRKTSIGYDLNSHITSIVRPNGTQRVVGYDAAGQTTNILEQTPVGFPIALFRHNWNANATMQWEFAAPQHNTNAPPTRTMQYDDDNRLTNVDNASVTVDSDGNLASGPLTNDTFATYAYDARNRLLNVGGITNAYDAMNNRVGQTYGTNTTILVVNPIAKLPQVLMRIKNGVTNYYVYGAGLLYQVTETTTATNTATYHYDVRGSTIALTDDNGNLIDRIEYSAYATLTYRIGHTDTPFLFNGMYGVQTDPNGLLYMKARYYNPFLCRFINSDPTGFSGGMNFYVYANGNPISLIDPFGLGFLSVTGHFLEGAAIGTGVAVIVVLAAPEIAAAGAATLVYAGVEAATATTVATATVSGGLYVAGGYGAYKTTANTAQDVGSATVTGNWDAPAFDAGNLTGGFVVGTTSAGIFGNSSGGRTLTDNLHAVMGEPPSQAPNTWNPATILNYEVQNMYNPSLGMPGAAYWATAPTPFSSGFTAMGIAGGVGSSTGK